MTIFRDLEPLVNGDDIAVDLRFTDDNGQPIDVTDDILYLTLKRSRDDLDSAAIMQVVHTILGDQFTRVGVVSFVATSAETNIVAGTYHYDFQWIKAGSGGGFVETILLGKVKIIQGVTRA